MIETCELIDGRGLKVVKKVGDRVKVRLVGNHKLTFNEHILDEPFQFVSINNQFIKLWGKHLSWLDVRGAYTQVQVGEGGDLIVVNTHKGFKKPTRMPFGIKTAPKIFQSGMDKLIQGID